MRVSLTGPVFLIQVFCKNDAAFLCQECNAAAHNNPLAARHTIVPAAEAEAEMASPVAETATSPATDASSNTFEKQAEVPASKLDKEALTKTVFGKDLEVRHLCCSIRPLHWQCRLLGSTSGVQFHLADPAACCSVCQQEYIAFCPLLQTGFECSCSVMSETGAASADSSFTLSAALAVLLLLCRPALGL